MREMGGCQRGNGQDVGERENKKKRMGVWGEMGIGIGGGVRRNRTFGATRITGAREGRV